MKPARTTRPGRKASAVLVATALLGGCAGASDRDLRDGVYEFELTEAYLLRNGVAEEQARSESGVHEVTLDRGSFVDRWRAADGTVGSCAGVYTFQGSRAAFRWTDGCAGDWSVTYSLDGDRVRWSGVEPLDPGAGAQTQRVAEVFNSVPWTWRRDVPEG